MKVKYYRGYYHCGRCTRILYKGNKFRKWRDRATKCRWCGEPAEWEEVRE